MKTFTDKTRNNLPLDQDLIRVTYTVRHDKPESSSELKLYRSLSRYWSNLLSTVYSNKFKSTITLVSKLREVCQVKSIDRLDYDHISKIINGRTTLGVIDLISCSYLFDKSPLDLQLFILAGIGVTPTQLNNTY